MPIPFDRQNSTKWQFYYNTISLEANNIINQFVNVLTSYKMMGINIMGIMCGRGSGNEHVMCSMANNLHTIGPWTNVTLVSFVNPCDPTQYMHNWPCGLIC